MKINPGDVVFYKEAFRSNRQSSEHVRFKGFGFGVALGCTAPFQQPPKNEDLMIMMATAGFISIDDVLELAGSIVGGDIVAKWQQKYLGTVLPLNVKPLEKELLGQDGKPIPAPRPPLITNRLIPLPVEPK